MRRNKRPSLIFTALWALAALYFLFFRKRIFAWGAQPSEAQGDLPGDDLVADPVLRTTRAITIQAAPEQIWPWLVQMGQGRGGFYSYDWLENLFGMNIHNADRILPEFQSLKVGDPVPFWENANVYVTSILPCQHLALAGTIFGPKVQPKPGEYGGSWVFTLQPVDHRTTRLVVRSAVAGFDPYRLCMLFTWLLLEPSHFIMELGMLKGIKRRVEQSYAPCRSW